MKKTYWWIGLSLAAVLVLVLGNSLWQNSQKQHFQRLPDTENLGRSFEQMGIMSQQNYIKYDVISESASKTGAISDGDLAWMLALAKSTPTKHGLKSAAVLHSLVFDEFRMVKHLTPPQKEQVMQAVLPLTSSTNVVDQMTATSLLYTLDDSRAVPYLRPMLNSPNPQVRDHASVVLKHLHAL